jgi:hypothetical protein
MAVQSIPSGAITVIGKQLDVSGGTYPETGAILRDARGDDFYTRTFIWNGVQYVEFDVQLKLARGGYGGITIVGRQPVPNYPIWHKVTVDSSDTVFTGYYSTDGNNWYSFGSYTYAATLPISAGFYIDSGDSTNLAKAHYTNTSVNGQIAGFVDSDTVSSGHPAGSEALTGDAQLNRNTGADVRLFVVTPSDCTPSQLANMNATIAGAYALLWNSDVFTPSSNPNQIPPTASSNVPGQVVNCNTGSCSAAVNATTDALDSFLPGTQYIDQYITQVEFRSGPIGPIILAKTIETLTKLAELATVDSQRTSGTTGAPYAWTTPIDNWCIGGPSNADWRPRLNTDIGFTIPSNGYWVASALGARLYVGAPWIFAPGLAARLYFTPPLFPCTHQVP